MKRRSLTAVLAGLMALLLLLTGCGNPDRLHFENEARRYVREGDGAVFYRASANYLAVRIDKSEEVGCIGRSEEDDLPLYAVCNYANDTRLDPDQYMADGDYNLYYAEGVTLPKLWEMEIEEIRLVQKAAVSYSSGAIDDAATIGRIVDRYQNGFSVAYTDPDCNFRIKDYEIEQLAFSSRNYGGFYYVLQYYRYEECVEMTEEVEDFDSFTPAYDFPYSLEEHGGKTYARYELGQGFLYDRATGLCYPAGDLLESYYND